REMFAMYAGEFDLFLDQVVSAIGAHSRNHAIQRLQPFAGFLGIVVFFGSDIFHDFVGYSGHARLLDIEERSLNRRRGRSTAAAASADCKRGPDVHATKFSNYEIDSHNAEN